MFRYKLNIRAFDSVINKTTSNDSGNKLTNEIKTYYSDYLIDVAEGELVHDQFGQKRPIPAGKGRTIEFRKWTPLAKITTELTEGVTPDGQALDMSVLTAYPKQYGGYVIISDLLDLTAIDDVKTEATQLIGSQAGRSLDTIVREILNAGTNVQYHEGSVASRAAIATDKYLTVKAIANAVRTLKRNNAKKIDGNFVAIIHPDVSYDLMNDSAWKDWHQYVTPENKYNGEIGMIDGVRFVETTEAKIFEAENLASDARELLVNHGAGYTGAITTLDFDGGTVEADALIGRYICINGVIAKITDNTSTALTFASTDFGTIADNAKIYPGEAGKEGQNIYSTLIIAKDAYGVTDLEGGGLQLYIKNAGSAGTADPIDQRSTVGWKAARTAERLVEDYMVRVETSCSYNA